MDGNQAYGDLSHYFATWQLRVREAAPLFTDDQRARLAERLRQTAASLDPAADPVPTVPGLDEEGP